NEIKNFEYKKNIYPINNNDFDPLQKEQFDKAIKNKELPKEKKSNNKSQNKKLIKKIRKFKQTRKNKLPLPSRSIISSSEFKFPSRGYVNLNGPKISLNLKGVDSIETLKLIGKLGNYGIIIIDNNDGEIDGSLNKKIIADFEEVDISDAFNSILLASNLQAIVENNIIFIGKNILNKSLKEKISKTYRLNQVNAASVADYLSTLGAQISKVMLVSGSIDGQEVGDGMFNKRELKDDVIKSYGIEGGPLFGLIGTADLRLQTITLIGPENLMKTAEKYIKSLDIRHRQVALTIKIIDVSLTKSDIKNNVFELRSGDTRIINNSGLGLRTGNLDPGNPPSSANVPNVITNGITQGNFINWLEAKITNENAKILASPTLILGENPNILSSGAAAIDDGLSAATIGRPFKNEGFIKVGETVVTGFTQTATEGVVTCTAQEGTAGITFGAKVDKIDDNGFVTFALSPAISSVTKTVEISGCGIQNTLSVRKLDTGSIRVKNKDTLILTGVLQDSDTVTTSKVPILGDVPIIGSLFRNNSTQKRKSELIILVTPKILKDK
ncbi:hypothetical protein OA867_01755, partial [Prochlorococcus sp. AH-716-D22]|nr:hypothetical protein [Prochlorococcus sp. AH-716-D22]